MPTVSIPLSCLDDYYINWWSHSAADLLHSCIKIIVDVKYLLDPSSDHSLPQLLPHSLLGVDPPGSMLFIGYQGQAEAWLSMGLHTIDELTELSDPGFKSGPTLLSHADYHMTISFFAFILAKNTDLSFICYDTYGIGLTVKEPAFQDYFSILFVVYSLFSVIPLDDISTLPRKPEYPTIEMRLKDPTLMDQHMSTHWDKWVPDAPDACAQITQQFDNIPMEQITAENQDLVYDSWDPDICNHIPNLDALPLVDEDGNEVQIYNEDALFNIDPLQLDDGECPIHLSLYLLSALLVMKNVMNIVIHLPSEGLLPHKHISEQLSPANCPQDLHLEQVYNLDLHSFPEEHWNGRYIYTNIILPLTKGWEVPTIVSQLKQHVSIYTSDAYPALFEWVTYPV
ncbi:hypothetical protein BS47DRAFT_1363928 [Hydnum rufescens UP504]|uniref:DUF8190 domain-containing protein n=1 Tax=Hydnum rufescens UP504 TaxID=1448309 RepID=A0A9P6DU63_9AGAM|nr:hypothetical protein BS47DRAFT_1363928 [Hydnum rufescens UP504]